jgi:hypothetical protein
MTWGDGNPRFTTGSGGTCIETTAKSKPKNSRRKANSLLIKGKRRREPPVTFPLVAARTDRKLLSCLM